MRSKRELRNETFLPTVGLHPTTSCLLDWRSNQLHHGSVAIANIYRYIIYTYPTMYPKNWIKNRNIPRIEPVGEPAGRSVYAHEKETDECPKPELTCKMFFTCIREKILPLKKLRKNGKMTYFMTLKVSTAFMFALTYFMTSMVMVSFMVR